MVLCGTIVCNVPVSVEPQNTIVRYWYYAWADIPRSTVMLHYYQTLPWDRAQQMHWKGSCHTLQADKKSLDKQQAHRAHEHTGVHSLCGEHPSVRQRIMDPALPAREETQQFPYALHGTHSWHLEEKQGDKQRTVLERAGIPTMVTLLKQMHEMVGPRLPHGRRTHPQGPLRWAGDKGRPTGRPQLRYKDICKRDLKALGINTDTWKAAAADRSTWKQEVKKGLSLSLKRTWRSRQRRKGHTLYADRPATPITCGKCHRECHSRIGLLSHTRRCWDRWTQRAELHGLPRSTGAYYCYHC